MREYKIRFETNFKGFNNIQIMANSASDAIQKLEGTLDAGEKITDLQLTSV